METHVKVLGILNVVWGAVGLVGALVVLTLLGGVAGLVAVNEQSEDAVVAVSILSMLAVAVPLFIAVLSAPSIIIGVGLLKFVSWARVLGIVLSTLHLLSFPVGTVLGVYGLWVLLSRPTESLFEATPGSRPISL